MTANKEIHSASTQQDQAADSIVIDLLPPADLVTKGIAAIHTLTLWRYHNMTDRINELNRQLPSIARTAMQLAALVRKAEQLNSK